MSSKTTSTLLGLSLAVVIVALVVLRVTGVFPPIDKKTELIGTIGGVEKADKFRGEQFSFEDVKIDNPEVAEFVQGATFQNLMKDENFRALITNQEFVKLLPQVMEVNNKVYLFAVDLQNFLSNAQNFQKFFSRDFNAFVKSAEFNKLALRPEVTKQIELTATYQQMTKAFEVPSLQEVMQLVNNRDFQKSYFASNELQKIVPMSQDFKYIVSQDFQKFAFMSTDFNLKVFQSFYASQEFQKMAMNADFQKAYMNQDFQKFVLSQDFQKIVLSQDFQKYFDNQDFQRDRSQ